MAVVRVNKMTHDILIELSRSTGMPVQTVLEQAIEAHRQTIFLEQLNREFAALRNDPAAWEEEIAERRLWEQTLGDGILEQRV